MSHASTEGVIQQIGQTLESWVCSLTLLNVPDRSIDIFRWTQTSKLRHTPSSCYVATDFREHVETSDIPLTSHVDFLPFSCVFYGDLYPNPDCFDQATSDKITQLLTVRKMFAYGPSKDYFLHQNCIGFVRMGDSEHPGCAVVMSNESPGPGCVPTTFIWGWCSLMGLAQNGE